jgi:DNA-binding NarL/FixJ family response regulator
MQEIIVADDHELYRTGMVNLLAGIHEFRILAQVSDPKSLLAILLDSPGACVIASASLASETPNLLDVAQGAACRILLVTEDWESPQRYRSFGAAGIVRRSTPPPSLIQALRRIRDLGGKHPPASHPTRHAGAGGVANLSPGEMTMVALLMLGYKNRRIAETLGVSEQAVRSRFQKVFDKTGLSTRLELALFIAEHSAMASAMANTGAQMGPGTVL